MTMLKLYAPASDEPVTVPFPDPDPPVVPLPVRLRRDSALSVLQRSRTIFKNRLCPHCRQSCVSTIELDDGLQDEWRFTVPGTASLVGFHCRNCGSEWAPQ